MIAQRCRSRRFGIVFVSALSALVMAVPASPAGMIAFETTIENSPRSAHTEILDSGGVPYVSLTAVVKQFRGGCSILTSRAQVDLNGRAAWLGLNDREVKASTGTFLLEHPVLTRQDNVVMALADVPAFFRQAFLLTVVESRPADLDPESPRQPGSSDESQIEERALESLGLSSADASAAPAEPIPGEEAAEAALLSQDLVTSELQRIPNPTVRGPIVIDPGHGGGDDGVTGPGGFAEKDLALGLATRIKTHLEEILGSEILLTREEDAEVPLALRTAFARNRRAALFISLHAGASLAPAAHGFEVFSPSAREISGQRSGVAGDAQAEAVLANAIDAGLAQAGPLPSRGVRRADCRVLSGLDMPRVLIEAGCLNNPAEESLLRTAECQDQLARGIAEGIREYLAQAPREMKQ